MSLSFRPPRRDEMALRARWLADPGLMAYNARWPVSYPGYHPETGCIDFPDSEWDAWFESFVANPPDGRRYWFVEDAAGVVGHAHHRLRGGEARRVADIGFMVVPDRRGQGLAAGILQELVRRCFDAGFEAVHNEFETSRAAAVRVHERLGFIPVPGTSSSVGGRTVVEWELTRDAWSHPA